MKLRNRCYDMGIFSNFQVNIPVVSVGNLTAGGTGKTPLVEYIVRYFINQRQHVAIISRGYKRRSREPVAIIAGVHNRGNSYLIGDEPYQMARRFPQASIIVDSNRRRAARYAAGECRADVIVLDDGFQHRKLARDLDIVLIDRRSSVNKMRYLPAGYKREAVDSLQRADLIAYTGTDSMPDLEIIPGLEEKPKITMSYLPKKLYSIQGDKELPVEYLRGKRILAFCGIGNPASFHQTIESLGATVVQTIIFADHHYYTHTDLQKIRSLSERGQSDCIVTTEKDAVRFEERLLESLRCDTYYLEIETVVTEGKELLETMLDRVMMFAQS